MGNLIRRIAAVLAACAIVTTVPSSPRAAQVVPAIDKSITYILPQWIGFASAPGFEVNNQIDQLRNRVGPEGKRVKLGFTLYIGVSMAPVDPTDLTAIRAELQSTFDQVDHAIAKAEAAPVPFPICLSFVTALRQRTDPLQDQEQSEDRRNMQWHADKSMAVGWTTLSRYARKQEAIREAFLRELGRFLAKRMLEHPGIVVAASGDGEIELSYERSLYGVSPTTPPQVADYSPFAVAEFRDWLRGTGLYAAGQPFAGEAYTNSARYAADAALATLNADFGQTFSTWALKYEDWSLADSPTADPRAIPASTYNQSGWLPTVSNANGFDPPRTVARGTPWWDVWDQFRQVMVWRYNMSFAKWITTSPDLVSGATVPADRWFSDQIMADYLFGNVAPNYDLRLDTSASPHWTADIRPYGSMGITAFNQYNTTTGTIHKTLAAVAPAIAQRNVRWGILEWNPSLPVHPSDTVYHEEMALVEQYKPSLLVPFYWKSTDGYPIEDTGFERALKALVARLNVVPLVLSRTSLVAATTADGAHHTPPQLVRVGGVAGETPQWSVASWSPFLDVAVTADGRGFTVAPKGPPQTYALQPHTGTVVVSSTNPDYSPATLTVTVTVAPANGSAPPFGSFDTPAEGAAVSGEVGVTGWAIDDIGIAGIDIYRTSVAPEAPNTFIFLGSATMVPGARPDVQATYAVRPLAEQAGWGYMLLTNMLPNQGNGSFVLHAFARDVDGYSVVLGSRVINSANTGSPLPFGTIDTPLQGQTVSGTIYNFGWAVSPALIPIDGSTIGVYIDGVLVGRPTYDQRRADIEALFPNFPNTMNGRGAVGFFRLDTTLYANGVHTIAWVVTDSAGKARGIGSRYFTIANP